MSVPLCKCPECAATTWLITYYNDEDSTSPVWGEIDGDTREEAMRNFGEQFPGAVLADICRKSGSK